MVPKTTLGQKWAYLQIQYQMSLIAQNRHTFSYYNHLWLGFQENCVLNCIWIGLLRLFSPLKNCAHLADTYS